MKVHARWIRVAVLGVSLLGGCGDKPVENHGQKQMKTLETLTWKPKWVTHLGCLKGCLDYLEIDVSDSWLFGASGHAFIINIHEEVCPSGPTAWNSQRLVELCRNIGFELDIVQGHKSQKDFVEKQRLAWEKVRKAIDEGSPCYGWELDIPEYYVIFGYDDQGYYFKGPGCCSGKGPLPWGKLGDTDIGVIKVVAVREASPAEDGKTVKEALQFALEHSKSPDKWIFPKYKAGLSGYDLWIEALKNEKAHGHGTAYNAAVWCECREHAVKFLREAKERLDRDIDPLLDEAIGQYEVAAEELGKVSELFPFLNTTDEEKEANVRDSSKLDRAIESLRIAREAEAAALGVLEKIVAKLD